ncbi:MAG: 3-deoxy-D-manno-octulosonic acid transferase [Muribaculaceae bacterium]|nr:3-deoxy-D-manno-octulosonic acid transferase [Muribaculaceae bacterium]
MIKGQAETFATLQEKLPKGKSTVWVHAASLGEFEQGRTLIELIKREHPQVNIVLSFFSPSGYEVRKGYEHADVVCYLPFDTPKNAKRFINLVNPSMAIFVKYEFWGNYLSELKKRNVPTFIVSAIFRPKQIFFRPWGGTFRKMLGCFTTLFVQNEESRKLLIDIGVENVEVTGDTRFDRVQQVRDAAREFPTIEAFTANSPFSVVVGSSWQPDEDIIIPFFNAHPDIKLILAPHEFDTERLDAIKSKITRPVTQYSQVDKEHAGDYDCMIIDTFGILSSLYRYGQVACVGGGFGAGIHNINEAAVYGIPVLFGPKFSKFREASDLIACGGGFTFADAAQFNALMEPLLNDPAKLKRSGNTASNYIKSHLGATKLVYHAIERWLPND